MTQTKAATVAAALVTAGYFPNVVLLASGQYAVSVSSAGQVDVTAIQTFATNNGVTAKADSAVFV